MPISLEQATTHPSIVKAYFLHDCCGSGHKFFTRWRKDNPNTKIEAISYLNVKEQGFDSKYGFDLITLKKYSFIIIEEVGKESIVLKGENI